MDVVDKNQSIRFISGIEDGSVNSDELYNLLIEFDPLLANFLLRYLREKYPANREGNDGASSRLIELLTRYPDLAKLANKPQDAVFCDWFDDTYSMKEFFNNPKGFVDTIVDKLEG